MTASQALAKILRCDDDNTLWKQAMSYVKRHKITSDEKADELSAYLARYAG